MNRLSSFAALFCVWMVCPPALAMQPLITDDTATQGRGGRQLEASLSAERSRPGEGSSSSLPLTFSWGARDDLDLSLASGFVRNSSGTSASGWSNLVLGAKWRLLGGATSFALKPELLLPSSDAALGPERVSGRLALLLSQVLPFGALHTNLSFARERYGDPTLDAGRARFSLAPVWDLSAHWKLAADFGLERVRSGGLSHQDRYAELGTVWSPRADLDLALGLIRSLDDQSPRQGTNSVTLGVSGRFLFSSRKTWTGLWIRSRSVKR